MDENPRKNAQQDARRVLRERLFQAVVTAKSGGLIKIRRLDQAAADGQFYPAATGLAAAVSAGDFVVCVAVGGTVIVLAKYVTS
ncbi:MAG: hypothetical protein IT357_04985 [Gemmatimonadaceae bacterium]|nr:hypothetical protein [Gemmatimonadaceae bacterium]